MVNRCVETYLWCFAGDKTSRWYKWLAWAEYHFNTDYHTATEISPFKIVYGREPHFVMPYEPNSTTNFEVEELLIQKDATFVELKEHLLRAQ